MKKNSISVGFSRYSDRSLGAKAHQILDAMSGNPNYPDPTPSLPDIRHQLAEFEASLHAINGSKIVYPLKRRARTTLEGSLKLLGRYVLQHADEDGSTLGTTGFDLTSRSRFRSPVPSPVGFRVKTTMGAGQAGLCCEAVDRAKGYVFQYTEAPLTGDSVWTTVNAALPAHLFKGLISGQAYCFRAAAVGKNASKSFTEVITRYVS